MIIDAHAHITDQLHGRSGQGKTRSLAYGKFMRGEKELRLTPPLGPKTSFPPELLLEYMDWIGVDKTVLLQGSTYGDANEYLWRAVRQWPERFIAAAFVDPRAPDAHEVFRRATDEYGFRILKFEMSELAGFTGYYPDLRLDSDEMAWIWEAAARLDLVVTLDLGAIGSRAYQTAAVKLIIGRFPDLNIVIARLAQPPFGSSQSASAEAAWEEQLTLARHANVWLDMSALPALSVTEDYPYPIARFYLQRAVELVGADKIMWGTDAPGLLQHATYAQLLSFMTQNSDFLSSDQLEQILGATAHHVYWH